MFNTKKVKQGIKSMENAISGLTNTLKRRDLTGKERNILTNTLENLSAQKDKRQAILDAAKK